MAKLKLKNATELRIASARRGEPGPERTRSVVRQLQKDAATLVPAGVEPPAAVADALHSFEAACAWTAHMADELEAAKQARVEAAKEDVRQAAAAMAAGKPAPAKLKAAKADEAISSTLVGLEAAETLVMEAHTRLVDAVADAWTSWRRRMVTEASEAHDAAREAVREAVEAVKAATARYSGVGHLDAEIRSRFPDVKAAIDAERRAGLPWYEETHLPSKRPLGKVLIPVRIGQINPAGNLPIDLDDALQMVAEVVTADADWPAAEWLPPGDHGHDAALTADLDLEAPWVHGAVGRARGGTCILCDTDTGEPTKVVDDDGVLVLVHSSCLKRHENDPKHKRLVERAEKEAKWRERQREQGGLSPRDERYGEAAADSVANRMAEEERDPECDKAMDRLYESGGISKTPADYKD